jgi:hypothetical protein
VEEEELGGDPYVQLLLRHLEDPRLFDGGPDRARALQQELLVPFLDFFLRHDRDGYYAGLYARKGLLDGTGTVRSDVVLEDLAALRIHSDDLRGERGQRRRLIAGVDESRSKVFASSGTTGNAEGPVTIVRSPLTQHCMHLTMGRQMEQAAGHAFEGTVAMMFATEPMRRNVGLPCVVSNSFEQRGAELVLGARMREADGETDPWRLIEPDPEGWERFQAAPVAGKVAMVPTMALPLFIAAGTPVDLGEDGVLFTGGGLKRIAQYATMAELLEDARTVFRAGDEPAPIVDALGLTESASCFPAAPDRALKVAHPLTYVGLFDSPQRLELVDGKRTGLLFFVNLMCLDYLEAIVPGDVVERAGEGFVYLRRAGEEEGFRIREGCG